MSESQIKFADLFCGMGSFHQSVAPLGWKCVFACDINKNAQNTYSANHGLMPAGDIRQIDVATVPPFDVLCSGFPCQPFSVIGNRKGFDDKNGDMFFETMRFVEHHQPKAVILENVYGLVSNNGGKTLTTIIETLAAQGYHVQTKVLVCSDYGIPQRRKRIFIVGTKTPMDPALLDFENEKKTRTLTEFLNEGKPQAKHLVFTQKDTAYTIRTGGKGCALDRGHNWDGYMAREAGEKNKNTAEFVYRLTVPDLLKLQGFDVATFKLVGSERACRIMLGNTIPTVFTRLVGGAVNAHLKKN